MRQGVLDINGCAINWAVEQRAKYPDTVSGDGYLLRRIGPILMAVVSDGTGSGSAAAEASNRCLSCLSDIKELELEKIFHDAHQALEGTRGAALGIALISFEKLTLNWAAIGDIDGMLCQKGARAQSMLQRGGTVGVSSTGLLVQRLEFELPATIMMVSDGISRNYRSVFDCAQGAEALVSKTVSEHGRRNDDAIALAINIGPLL